MASNKVYFILFISSMCWMTNGLSEDQSPVHFRERYKQAVGHQNFLSRKRRQLKVPKGTAWEVKWALNLPFETVLNRYSSRIQFAFPIKVKIPAILFEEYGKAKLKGGHFYEKEVDGYHSRNGLAENNYNNYIEDHKDRNTRSIKYYNGVQDERIDLYRYIEGLFDKLGLPPQSCLMRTICEVAESPLQQGIMGDFLNLFLTPSLASPHDNHTAVYHDYVTAEQHGSKEGSCHETFRQCQESMFDLLPLVAKVFFSQSL